MSLIAIEAFWEYQTTLNDVPADPALVTVPTIDWLTASLSPFGEGDFTGSPLTPPNTVWTRATGLWIRRGITVNGQAPVLITGNCEQAMYLYFNGSYVGTLNPTNTNRIDTPEYNVVIPVELATTGTHEIALLCLDDASISTGAISYISIEADYLPAFLPLQPEAPVNEELAWFTDVIVSKDGSEERLQISQYPRQKLTYNYPAIARKKADALNIVWGALPDRWLVPIWPQAKRYGAISAGLTTLANVNLDSELRAPGLMLIWQNDSQWQIVGFDSFSGDDALLNTLTQAFTNAWIMPLRFGFIDENATRKFFGYDAAFDLTFRILDNKQLTPAAPTQYLGNDIYTEPTLMQGSSLSDDIISNLDVFDPGVGPVAFYSNWLYSKTAKTYRVVCEGLAETWELREFLHRRAGRLRPFWQPTFENDLVLQNTGTIANTLLIQKDNFLRYATARENIAVEAAGVWYPRAITLITEVDADTVQLTLSGALNVAASSVSRVSWLGLRRLNADRVEIRYIGGGVAEVSFRTLEISP